MPRRINNDQLSRDQLRALVREYVKQELRRADGAINPTVQSHMDDLTIHFAKTDVSIQDLQDLDLSLPSGVYNDRVLQFTADSPDSLEVGPRLRAGEYTPTLSNTTNVASSTARVSHWLGFFDRVKVSATISLAATVGTNAMEFDIDLPVVPGNFPDNFQAAGVAGGVNGPIPIAGFVRSVSGTPRARIIISAPDTTATFRLNLCFGYKL
jgi:hypothetical protein